MPHCISQAFAASVCSNLAGEDKVILLPEEFAPHPGGLEGSVSEETRRNCFNATTHHNVARAYRASLWGCRRCDGISGGFHRIPLPHSLPLILCQYICDHNEPGFLSQLMFLIKANEESQ